MKKKILFAVSLAVGIVLVSLAADSPAPKPSEADAIRELRGQIVQLRADVQALQQRTKSLESAVEGMKRPHGPTPLNLQPGSSVPAAPQIYIPAPSPSRPPTVWGQREVNGWTYYIVPCEERSR